MATTRSRSLFRMRQYDCVGFDMDHTLCRYRLPAFFEMEYQVLVDYLIHKRGYDVRLKRPLVDDVDFLHKGLVMDVERGNFVKLSAKGDVLRASHGTKPMTAAEITAHYGLHRTNESFRLLATDPMQFTEGHNNSRKYRPFKDYFDLPAAVVCARIVDILDYQNGNKPLEKYNFWRDVLCGLVDMFSRDNLKINAGGYYPKIKLNPELYLRPCGDRLKKWLRELKNRQVTYLISGSDPEYVQWVAGYCLGNDWKNYFDYIICASKKPGFFTGNKPFRRCDEDIDIDELIPANNSVIYIQGNWNQLKNSMAEYAGVDHPKCLYFGDHLIQDIQAADSNRIDVVAIVEEVELETTTTMWGSFFKDDGLFNCCSDDEGTTMNTLWGNLVEKHAKICISYMKTLSDYPADHNFTFIQKEGHGKFLGFLPNLPNSLI